MGINTASLLTAAGIGGLAVGFGAQNLVKDVITGFFIILEDQYNVGDYVEAAGVKGIVDEIGLRTTGPRLWRTVAYHTKTRLTWFQIIQR